MVTVLVAPAACSKSRADRAGPTATVATEPAPTTTTNPYAVPTVIDVAYVNRVLAGLDAAEGEIVRLVFRTNTIPTEGFDRIKALYQDADRLQREIDGLQRDIRNRFSDYRTPPGNRITTTSSLITARPTCIFAQVNRDYRPVGTNPLPGLEVQWVALRPLEKIRDPDRYNPTDWAFVYDGFPADHSRPSDPCAS